MSSVIFGDPRLPARFWVKVNENGPIPARRPDLGPCWLWMGCRQGAGYGQFKIGSRTDGSARMVLAHRLAYETLVEPIPDGLESDHLCRNRACINPAHIEPVTGSVNLKRSPLAGQHSRGEANGNAKLREVDIPIIRTLRGQLSQAALAQRFGVSHTQIGRIQCGKYWMHTEQGDIALDMLAGVAE